jgi:hypothetical protein
MEGLDPAPPHRIHTSTPSLPSLSTPSFDTTLEPWGGALVDGSAHTRARFALVGPVLDEGVAEVKVHLGPVWVFED